MGRMIYGSLTTAAIVLAGMAFGGCKSSTPPPDSVAPTSVTPEPPALAMGKAPAEKDLTHEVTKDEPLFASEPAAGAKPDGMIKAGSKVLVLIPGVDGGYSQVLTDTGISAYTPADGLKPVGK